MPTFSRLNSTICRHRPDLLEGIETLPQKMQDDIKERNREIEKAFSKPPMIRSARWCPLR